MTTPTPAVPVGGTTEPWTNRFYQNTSHIMTIAADRTFQLYTSVWDATAGAMRWVADNRAELLRTAVDSMPAGGLALQAVGTARGDSAQGAGSAYNWGVVLTGVGGAYNVAYELRTGLSSTSDRPGNLPRMALGAMEAAGAGMYAGLAGPNPTLQSIGAGVQAAGAFGQTVMNNWQRNAADNRLPVTAPTSNPVAAVAPQIPAQSFDPRAAQGAPAGNPVAAYTHQTQPASYTTGQTSGQASGSNRGAYNTNQHVSNRGRGR
ncbi:hypothetical protein [Streptomyces sp. NPDC101249]|uniref:hypothetical protein n=1 Tax=Streptomyces sp. NPDC101249 TaxID=3366140 RepID=UPI00382B27CC